MSYREKLEKYKKNQLPEEEKKKVEELKRQLAEERQQDELRRLRDGTSAEEEAVHLFY